MKWINKLLGRCNHEWECAEIGQVRIVYDKDYPHGRLEPYTIKTMQLLECKKCKKRKRMF